MTKQIDTLVEDIYTFMAGGGDFPDFTREQIDNLTKDLGDVLYTRLQERRAQAGKPREFQLRMSNYGMPSRKLWYESHIGRDKVEPVNPVLYLNFLIGDIWECVVLTLAQLTGHTVERQQETVEVDGLVGHIDAVIDNVLCDVKSTSKWSFEKKFTNGALFTGEDSFSYIPQIKGYGYATQKEEQAFLAANKETGQLALVKVPESVTMDVPARIKSAFEVCDMPSPPEEKCYPDEEMGASGNRVLSKDCTFCAFKHMCWADANNGEGLRTFSYAGGNKYFTKVVKAPAVEEVVYTKREPSGYIYQAPTKAKNPMG